MPASSERSTATRAVAVLPPRESLRGEPIERARRDREQREQSEQCRCEQRAEQRGRQRHALEEPVRPQSPRDGFRVAHEPRKASLAARADVAPPAPRDDGVSCWSRRSLRPPQEEPKKPSGPPTWYAQALARGDAGLNVTHFWSKGAHAARRDAWSRDTRS